MRTAGRFYDLAAAGLAAGLSGLELARLVIFRGATKGLSTGGALVMGLTFCAVLIVAAFGLGLRRRFGWAFGVFGFVAALSHGSVLRAGGNWIGVLYMLASIGMLAALIKDLPAYYSRGIEAEG